MQPLRITVRVKVVFTGVTMNMGVNETRLPGVGERSFAGEVILPVCVRQSMDWQARVVASGPDGNWQTAFFFATRRP